MNEMPDFSVPSVMKMNCEPFYLHLLGSGASVGVSGNPEDLNLLDNPRERMLAAKESLKSLGAIEIDNNSRVHLTSLGKAINEMPFSCEWSKAVLTGANLIEKIKIKDSNGKTEEVEMNCVGTLSIIACLSEVCARKALFLRDVSPERWFSGCSGDHEMLLKVK